MGCMLCFISQIVRAQHPLMVSYVEHPAVTKKYMPVVKAMYQEANIDTKLFLVNNSPRSVKALNEGFFDADIGKILSSIKGQENIIYVPTPIASVSLYLICRKQVVCDKKVLDDNKSIIASRFNREMLTNILPIRASISQILSQQRINKMLRIGRVNYSLVADDSDQGDARFHNEFQVIEVSRENYYHILHRKHRHLISRLDAALIKVLTEGLH